MAEPDGFGVAPEDAVADRVECAAPEPIGRTRDECVNAFGHLSCGFVGKSEEEDGAGRNALFQNPSYTVGQCACLATAGAGNDQRGPAGGCHSGELLVVQFRRVVYAAGGWRRCL